VRAVANVMGLRRGDTGDVETGSTHVDAMINAGYLEVLEYLPDPEPRVPRAPAKQFAQPNSFGNAEVVNLPDLVPAKDGKSGWVEPPPDPKEVDNGKPRKARPRPSRSRSAAGRRSTGNDSDVADVQPGVGDGPGGHRPDAGGAPDGETGN